MKTLYKHIHIKKGSVIKEPNSSSKVNQKMDMYVCTKTEENSGQTKQCSTTYKHKMNIKKNTIFSYVLETTVTCSNASLYKTEKEYYKNNRDVVFSDAKNSFTYYMGDGYVGSNGNEDIFKGKSITQVKTLAHEFDLGSCEVK